MTFRKDELRLIIGVGHAVENRRDAFDIGFSMLSSRGSIDNGMGCLMISPWEEIWSCAETSNTYIYLKKKEEEGKW